MTCAEDASPTDVDAPFVVDVPHERVHRTEKMTDECREEIAWDRAQFAPDILKASMVMKTRHYLPCPRCWQ